MKGKVSEIVEDLSKVLDNKKLPGTLREKLREILFKDAFNMLKELIDENRPPVLYLVGRSGHGKSSIINALAGKDIAEVGEIKPTTPTSENYVITFNEEVSWEIIDSRGLFESTTPSGALPVDVVELVKSDLFRYKPDVVLHVVSSPEVRSFSHDLKVFNELMKSVEERLGSKPVVIMALTKADVLGNPREWPPEEYPKKAALIKEILEYVGLGVLKIPYGFIDGNVPYRGIYLKGGSYYAGVPVCTLPEERWNVETLSSIIAQELPMSALLNYVRACRNKKVLKAAAENVVLKFAKLAALVGATPIPISDIVVLVPLQMLMITVIGYLAGRPLSSDTAEEYLSAAGITLGAGALAREGVRQLVKFLPIAGEVVSAAMAGGWTYALGKGAIEYFFEDTVVDVRQFEEDWKRKSGLKEGRDGS